jgi:hypothetical protein
VLRVGHVVVQLLEQICAVRVVVVPAQRGGGRGRRLERVPRAVGAAHLAQERGGLLQAAPGTLSHDLLLHL